MNLDRFICCAHRGASGYAPENSLAAFRLAMAMGAAMCELDVQQTADDRLVVMHDDTLERTTNGKGNVWEMTLAELQRFDAGVWFDQRFAGETLPSLEQVFELVRGKMNLNRPC
jgi:glycerophosphoryl diester phosphodiesterase